jgi:hypothetical protein
MDIPSLIGLLTPIFGPGIVKVGEWLIAAAGIDQIALMVLPVATAASPSWYQVTFGIMARYALNVGKNAPSPAPGQEIAGSIVPAPLALKQAATTPTPLVK